MKALIEKIDEMIEEFEEKGHKVEMLSQDWYLLGSAHSLLRDVRKWVLEEQDRIVKALEEEARKAHAEYNAESGGSYDHAISIVKGDEDYLT